ncbi:MarR family transcriptional regulator [bacterium]|nr:MarR family transcriptional regulator [bacterium]
MPDSELIRRVDRLALIMPQIIRSFERVPIRPASTPTVSLPQFRMLLMLDMDGDSSMGELARRVGVTMPTATSSINALVKGRHASRRRSVEDRRVVLVSITAKGRKVLEQLHQERAERLRAILSGLDADDQRALVEAFETILRLLRRIEAGEEPTDRASENGKS